MHSSPSFYAAARAGLCRIGLALMLCAVGPANAVTTKTLMDTLYLPHTGNTFVNAGAQRTQQFAVGSEDVRITSVTADVYDSFGSVTPFVTLCDQGGANCQTFTASGPASPGLNTFTGSYTALAGTTVSAVFNCSCSSPYGYAMYLTVASAPGITGPAPGRLFLAKAEGELLPAISALSHTEGPVAGGQSVTLTGAYLSDVTDVRFGGTSAASFAAVNANTITAIAPAQAAGTVDVTATTPSGTSVARTASRYTYVAPPVSADASSSVPYGANNAPISLNLSGGAATSLTVHTSPTHGTLAVFGASVSYTPTTGYAGADSFTYSVSNVSGSSMTAKQSIMVASPTISFSPTAPANASFGATYSHSLNSASGGMAPYSYLLASGALPGGLSLSSSGTISGTPTAVGTFQFMVSATDSSTGQGPFIAQSGHLSLTVNAPTIGMSPASLPNGIRGVAYSQAVAATGGNAPYRFTIASGSLPPGMALSANTGIISGTPTAGGSYTFTVSATDSSTGTGAPFSATRTFTVVIPDNRYTAPTSTGTGMATASFTGGGTQCTFTQRRFTDVKAVATAPPTGYTFPQGMFDFTADSCDVDSTLTVTLEYPSAIPANAVLMKYSPNATPRWFPVNASVHGNTITYSVRDGESGDDDGMKNGRIVDPVALALPLATASIPTLSEWALVGLALVLAGLGAHTSRRRAIQ
ncbi:MAG: IPTL-CTERM sorting domain-containing protein [Acidovorax sp.]|uniref:IPTL-CTERM sorting domain-containing protein n=1 Tax=Acidovorax sp. TaxID=1872122 RepID=UPI002636655D|nr:IPTL-CTERM sorting domain-containing protein [Acidovorax sp.]MDH4418779.1 IPTL-CTERM sorting domain-containing protein [Acidovorax sp.]